MRSLLESKLVLESAPTSRIAGLYWSRPYLTFKIEHLISKKEAKEVVRSSENFVPIERPFVADGIEDIIERFKTGNFGDSNLDDVIHFLATMPGGGARFLVGSGGDGSEIGSTVISKADLERIYKATRRSLYYRAYEEHADPEKMEPVKGNDGVVRNIDMDAHKFAAKESRRIQKLTRLNQQKYFSGNWLAPRRSPESKIHRDIVSTQLVEYYLGKMKSRSYNVMKALIPPELHGIFLSQAEYSQDIKTEQFRVVGKSERRAIGLEQQKQREADAAVSRFKAALKDRYDLMNFAKNLDDGSELEDAMHPYYTMYTEMRIPFEYLRGKMVNGFKIAFNSNLVASVDRDEWAEAYSWDTELPNLSVFVAEADKLSFMVKDKGTVISRSELRFLKKQDPNFGSGRGIMTKFLNWVVQTAILELSGDKEESSKAMVQTVMGPKVIFTVS